MIESAAASLGSGADNKGLIVFATQCEMDPLEEHRGMERFGQDLKLVALSFQILAQVQHVRTAGITGEEKQAAARTMFLDPERGFKAVESGHHDITEEQVRASRLDCRKRLEA